MKAAGQASSQKTAEIYFFSYYVTHPLLQLRITEPTGIAILSLVPHIICTIFNP
jgi:hypothetical protein